MKKQFTSLIGIALAAVLVAGCGSREKLASLTNDVFDKGSVPLKNGYSLHGYRLLNGALEHDRFVYVLEKDGQSVDNLASGTVGYAVRSSTNDYSNAFPGRRFFVHAVRCDLWSR
jgi:hypothetical protein